MRILVGPVLRPVARWAEQSQRGACRNAMIASTELAGRRRERIEVEEYLAGALAGATNPPAEPEVRTG